MDGLVSKQSERWYSLNKDKYEVGKIVSKTRYSEKLKEAILKAL